MTWTSLRRGLAALVLLAVGLPLLPSGAIAASGLAASAPRSLTVVRDAATPNDFTVSWLPPTSSGSSALDRYDVSVVADGVATVTLVPATQLSLHVTGRTFASTYKVKVSSRNLEGLGADTGTYTLWPAIPSAPSKLSGGRVVATPTTVSVTWAAPLRTGASAVTGYHLVLTRMVDGVHWSRDVSATTLTSTFTSLDLARTYSIAVQARNTQGLGLVGKLYVGNNLPAAPTGFLAVRDSQDPTLVRISWTPPAYTGLGSVTGYQIGTGTLSATTYGSVLSAGTTTATISLPVTSALYYSVRALNAYGGSYRAADKHVVAAGSATPVVPASPNQPVVIGSSGSTVTVNVGGAVQAASYGIGVSLAPQVATSFVDDSTAPPRTSQLYFGSVPNGIYLVTVRRLDTGAVIQSGLVDIGDVGAVTAGQWQVVSGSAKISGQTIDITTAGEVRILDTRAVINQDATLTTTATLHGGSGYGIFVRTAVTASGIDGYSFQVDPGWNNYVIIRHWYHGVECSSPLATQAFPAGFDPSKPKRLQVSIHGDVFLATADAKTLLSVPSLSAALASEPCHFPAPTGTRVGFRSWATSSSTFVGTTLTN